MYTLGTHFEVLLENIRPPAERIEAAQTLPPLVRNYLADHEEFFTVAPHTRLVGSYAQKMSSGDVKDVDFLVRVDGDPDENEPTAKLVLREMRDALGDLPEALGYSGSVGFDITRARRSVHVYFEEHDFHLDVVPCIAPDGFEEPLYVPDWGFNKWILSHPVGYVALLNDLNREHGRKVKRLGKLLKHFRDYQMKQRKPKSYWLGALLVHHIRREGGLDTSQPLAVLFRDLLNAVYLQYAPLLGRTDDATPNIPDPMLGHNVSWNWSRSHFETFMRRIDEGRRWASKALEASDQATAITWWQKVFGADYFPTDVSDRIASLAAAGLPGTAIVSGSGLVGATHNDRLPSIVSRPTTFHGDDDE